MKLKVLITLVVSTILFAETVCAQAVFSPVADVVNMGEVMYNVPSKAIFTFKNTGDQPLELIEVYPSCGCTSVEWTKGEIPVGGEGQIIAVYDAQMLGTFQKDLLVYTNVDEEPVSLYLQGRVVSVLTDQPTSDVNFPIKMGSVCLKSRTLDFGDISKGEKKTMEIQVLNTGLKGYRPLLMHLPSYLTAEYYPEALNAGRVGKIQLTLDAAKMHQYGEYKASIYMSRHMGDQVNEENKLIVSSVLLPDFSSMTLAEKIRTPRLKIEGDTALIWSRKTTRRKKVNFVLKNVGLSTLEVMALQLQHKGVNVSLTDRTLLPNETAKLKVVIAPSEIAQNASEEVRILLITNDQKEPKRYVTIKIKD